MKQKRVMLGSLLPAVWLLATMPCFCDWVADSFADRRVTSLSTSHACHVPSLSAAAPRRLSSRYWCRKPWLGPGSGDGLPLFVAAEWQQVRWLSGSLEASLAADSLANSWQFLWRAAAEPRAPAWVS